MNDPHPERTARQINDMMSRLQHLTNHSDRLDSVHQISNISVVYAWIQNEFYGQIARRDW